MSTSDLLAAATMARARAWVPYSSFPVGAAIRAGSGRIYAGCNVENAAYPQSQCAEATAIGVMVSAGETAIEEVVVLGGGDAPCTPCGGCRQRLAEFGTAATKVEIHSPEGLRLATSLGDLLPNAFGLGVSAARQKDAAGIIRERAPGFAPAVGLVLGSGLGPLAESIQPVARIPYTDLPGFPRPSVEGHAGTLLLGHLAGVAVACFMGRLHLYEGRPAGEIALPIRTLRQLGASVLMLTNAVGSLRPEVGPGSLVLIDDHLNLQGTNPLVGPNDDRIGPRFPDLGDLYDAELRRRIHAVAEKVGIPVHGGVFAGWLGPCFETPAEIRMLRVLGADTVGMSTVAEAIAAKHCGLRVAALSIVTNLAAGMAGPLSHGETLAQASAAAERVATLLRAAIPELVR